MRHLTTEELEAGLEEIRRSPADAGVLKLIVRRPEIGAREVLEQGELDLADGLVGDSWPRRGSARSADGSPHPDMQLNVMNARVAALVAQDETRWELSGDQLFVDLDLSAANVPPGTRLSIGSAVIEVTAEPHTGCQRFVERFGLDAMKFVNSPVGRTLQLRGINARVVRPGVVRTGDLVKKAIALLVLLLLVPQLACVKTSVGAIAPVVSPGAQPGALLRIDRQDYQLGVCTSGDREYFLGVDLEDTASRLLLRLVFDPLDGPRVRLAYGSPSARQNVVLGRSSCRQLDARIQPTGWRVNRVRDFSGSLDAECTSDAGLDVQAHLSFTHCH